MTTAAIPESARTGAAWGYSTGIVGLVVQLIYTSVTARVLGPDPFAAYAIAVSLVQMGIFFVGSGVGQAVLQSQRGDDEVRRSALTLVWGAGLAVGVIIFAASFVVFRLWDAPGLDDMTRLLAVTPLFAGLAAIATALLRREGRYRRASVIELSALLLAQGISLVAILAGAGGMGLALSSLLYPALTAVLAWLTLRASILPPLFQSTTSIRGLSATIGAQNLSHYVLYTAPLWVLGTYASPAALGGYSRAQSVATIPLGQLSTAFTRVAYPRLAQAADDRPALSRMVTQSTTMAFALALLVFAPVMAAGNSIVRVLLGPGWEGAGLLVSLWAVWAALNLAYVATGSALESQRMLGIIWRGQALSAGTLALTLALVLANHAPPSLAILASILSLFVAYAIQATHLVRRGLVSGPSLVATGLAVVVGFVLIAAVAYATAPATSALSPILSLLADGVISGVGAIAILAFMIVCRVKGATELWGNARPLIQRLGRNKGG